MHAQALLLLLSTAGGFASPVRFDQRQNGSLNVQLDLKDLEVYAIVEDEMIEGAMAHASDSVRPRPGADSAESLKAASPGSSTRAGGAPGPGGSADASVGANSGGGPSPSPSVHRRPNDKLSSVKNKSGGLLPHERSDSAPLAPSASWDGEDEDLEEEENAEPRGTTAVEARAAPAPAAATPQAAARPSHTQGVRPMGTVSVAHLHCGMGYYRDENGRCRRSRRPTSSSTRKNQHHRHGSLKQGAKRPVNRPQQQPASPIKKEAEKEVTKDNIKDSQKEAVKDMSKDTSANKSPGKETTKISTKTGMEEVTAKEPIKVDIPKEPAKEAVKEVDAVRKDSVKEVVKDVPKVPVKEAWKEAAKPPSKDQTRSPPSRPAPAASKDKVEQPVKSFVGVRDAAQPNKPADRVSKPAAVIHRHDGPSASTSHKITVVKDDSSKHAPPRKDAHPHPPPHKTAPVAAPAAAAAPKAT